MGSDMPQEATSQTRPRLKGACGTCGAEIWSVVGKRPREHCAVCIDLRRHLFGLSRAVVRLAGLDPTKTRAIRAMIFSEIVNRLGLDREALRERARKQARGDGGRFA